MAYEAEGRQIAVDLAKRYGKLLEARLKLRDPCRIVLLFERGNWVVPADFIFKFGYYGSGPESFHAFLEASGFKVSLSQVVDAVPGTVLRRSAA
jgi:hypothetical protein